MWNSSTPQRIKSRRELEQKIRHRNQVRSNVHYDRGGGVMTTTIPNFPTGLTDDDRNSRKSKNEDNGASSAPTLPLPKVLTDILLQTALLGIDTTAKLSKPTIELTKNTLLPQIIIPLLEEIWELYTPIRLQTWMKVVPTSLKNVGTLLWDTEAGRTLGEKAGHLAENVVDMASSEVSRQCCIDATISLIKLAEALHTPEIKSLLDQCAVGACRVVDVLSSGKAKQVWFDVSDAVWAAIEVGSDDATVVLLAEGCAQVCFALERERESLKGRRRRYTASAGAGDGDTKEERLKAAKRRQERDRRQMGTYPPGKRVVREEGGRDGFEEALLDGLNRHIGRREENQREFEDQIYGSIDNNAEGDGPPQRVMVPTNSSENIGGDVGNWSKDAEDDNENNRDEVIDPQNVIHDDESEITTEIEDLGGGDGGLIDYDDVQTQSSASEQMSSSRHDNVLAYEQDGDADDGESFEHQIDDLDWRANDDGDASEMYDNFEEPILQFYRRLNEVLVETRKQGKFDVRHSSRGAHGVVGDDKSEIEGDSTSTDAFPSPASAPVSTGLFGIRKKWWKLIIIASICGVAAMCMLWFAIGCYGFYVLVVGRGHISHPPPAPANVLQQPSNVVIQLVIPKSQEKIDACDSNLNSEECAKKSDEVASISLDDWNKLKLDVDAIIRKSSEEEKYVI